MSDGFQRDPDPSAGDLQPLHPNLALLQTEYDRIIRAAADGHLPQTEALRQAGRLWQRDDQGVAWRINPETGRWEFRRVDGEWAQGVPPAYGTYSATPQDAQADTAASRGQPSQLSTFTVDEDKLARSGPNTLVGATRREQPQGIRWGRWALIGSGAAAAAALAVALL